MFKPLNPLDISLSGAHLIEASAGTGKTWNIAAIYTRLIVLEHMNVDKILVVTFTNDATAELQNRLRARLNEALNALQNSENALCFPKILRAHCHDSFLFRLLILALKKERDLLKNTPSAPEFSESQWAKKAQIRLQLRIKAAISDFDHAAIFTIHSFCQRVLQDFAFYCQVPFQIQLNEDSEPTQAIVSTQDFWRQYIIHDPENARLIHKKKHTPHKQWKELNPFLARPYLHFRQPEESTNSWHTKWQAFQPKLSEAKEAFERIHPSLNGNSYSPKTYEAKWATLLTLPEECGAVEFLEIVRTKATVNKKDALINPFAPDRLREKTKKNHALNEADLAIFADFDALYHAAIAQEKAEQNALIHLDLRLMDYLRATHAAHKKEQPERHFDDLLLDVFHALQPDSPHAKALSTAISQQWHAALIDEFQDTDPLQYAIFHQTFGLAAQSDSRKVLFLVGDPKQAIYSFRGADIYAYLDAIKHSPMSQYSLNINHRSHGRLISSINALFSRQYPFRLPEIQYAQVHASREHSRLKPERKSVVVRWLNQNNPEKEKTLENIDILTERAAQWCAMEIAHLLNPQNTHTITDKALHAGQIAVLVRTHEQGEIIRNALKKYNIDSVMGSQKNSVFNEPEAQAFYALIALMIDSSDSTLLNFVLSGCLFEYNAQELHDFNANDAQRLRWSEYLSEAMGVWQKYGVYCALRFLLNKTHVESRLLAQKRDRSLTNIQQLLELLSVQDQKSQHPLALKQWLEQQLQAATKEGQNPPKSALLRLENDENLVKIITMHAAKGLQYPIVFCPFLFANQGNHSKNWNIIHHADRTELLHKSQLTESDEMQAEIETLSEELRLLYVALTRAEEQLIIYMAQQRNSEKNAFAYLLNWKKSDGDFINAWKTFFQTHHNADFELTSDSPIMPSAMPNIAENPPIYRAIAIKSRHFQRIHHTSFTGLTRQSTQAIEAERSDLLPALDPSEQNTPMIPTESTHDIAHFPAGTQAGICLHHILEQITTQQSPTQHAQIITQSLIQSGFDAEKWHDAVSQTITNTRQTPLTPHINLATLPEAQRLNEMEFVFHADTFSLAALKQWFTQQNALSPIIKNAAQQLHFHDISGFIHGFIDLLAHTPKGETLIIDYKSNHLGMNLADYHPDALDQTMAKHHYYLQALIYAIAAARYLNSRQQPPSVLSIRYLFLRGLDGIAQNGVWQWDINTADLTQWL